MTTNILSDHFRKKKVLVSPLNHYLNMQETNYGREIIPEIIWFDFLLEAYELRQTVEIVEALTDGLESVKVKNQPSNCCVMSCYARLSDDDKKQFLKHHSVRKVIKDVKEALTGFKRYYPEAPINFLLTNTPISKTTYVNNLKQALIRILDPHSIRATHALTCMFYAQAYAGHLVISDQMDRFDLNDIVKYPDTEESERVAAFVRTSAKTFITMFNQDAPPQWSQYFWERCYELEPCKIKHLADFQP